MANYLPDDIIQHIINWKDVKDTREYTFKVAKIMRETTTEYNARYTHMDDLQRDLDWLDGADETTRDLLIAEIYRAIDAVNEIATLREESIIVAREALQQYLAAKALVA